MKYFLITIFSLIAVEKILANRLPLLAKLNNENAEAYLNVCIENFEGDDSLILYLYRESGLGELVPTMFPPERIVSHSSDSIFRFKISEIMRPLYFTLRRNGTDLSDHRSKAILNSFLMEPGDSVNIIQDGYTALFYGHGSEKYSIKQQMDLLLDSLSSLILIPPSDQQSLMKNVTRDFKDDSVIRDKLISRLNHLFIRRDLVYKMFYTDIIGKMQGYSIRGVQFTYGQYNITQKDTVTWLINQHLIFPIEIPDSVAAMSRFYLEFLWNLARIKYRLKPTREYYLTKISKEYKGKLRDKLLTLILVSGYAGLQNSDSCFTASIGLIESERLKTNITNFYFRQQKGRTAFNFSLTDLNGKEIKLSDFKGKVVFMDFWYIGCTPCVSYYKDFVLKAEQHFKDNVNMKFISVNIGGKKEAWKKAVELGLYTSTEIINVYTGLLGYDHPVIKYYFISGAPKPMLIDKSGKIFTTDSAELGSDLVKTINKALSL